MDYIKEEFFRGFTAGTVSKMAQKTFLSNVLMFCKSMIIMYLWVG
jgi:hypothetical protein